MILFVVCAENSCRSPRAEFMWRSLIHDSSLISDSVQIQSAGTHATPGHPIPVS
ncbi:MAG: hypothetical protein AAGA75_05540 [Cyanobacteria bacterium P01_E01_bin.6]